MDESSTPTPLRRRHFVRIGLGVLAALLLVVVATATFSSRESRALGREVAGWLSQLESGAVLEAEVSVTAAEGLPEKIVGQGARLRWASPDRLFLRTAIEGREVLAARQGDTVWVHLPESHFTVVGDNSVPRFSADPASVESVVLPDFAPPLSASKARLLPFVVKVSRLVADEGKPAGRRIEPSWLGRVALNLPEFALEIRGPDQGGVHQGRIEMEGHKSLGLDLARIGFLEAAPPESDWSPPTSAPVERVSLSHLVRCARVLHARLGAKTPPLPEATGRVELVARSGAGRLEDHDGVRVLFLSGTPEEMGRQQGELLRDEVRSLVERVVYGVGVGSSFAKGRWFFGEIEEAQGRLEPFIPASHLREMDAIASAAGLHPQESRLANFFPELFHCSGFALHGTATADGRIYHGRILDYIRGAGLEDHAVVMICRPEGGNAWVNVTYAGFIGSVTAMNEKKLAIGEMGGRGEGDWDGKPMAQLVREVMETCDTIDEAVELMRRGPRTCEYYYVISDAKSGRAVGIKATPTIFETVWSGESHPQLPDPVADTVLMSAGDRYEELVRRVKAGFGSFDADSARALMTRPVCMKSNIQSVLFAPDTLEFWVANADSENVASHTRYTRFNLTELLAEPDKLTVHP